MKNIAIVTGASSGMGREFASTVENHVEIDELWVIARSKDALESLKYNVNVPLKIITMDLSEEKNLDKLEKTIAEEEVNIKLLVNASGFGKFEETTKISTEDNLGMIKLNCEALTRICLMCLPYMTKGAKIVNFASVAAFQPVPYINVYAATKAYVLSFSRSLNAELKKDGISVMAVCPFWTKTKFFDRAVTENNIVKKYVAMYDADSIVHRAWRDLKHKKDVSQYGFIARSQVLLCKLLPHKLIMWIWKKQQKLQ